MMNKSRKIALTAMGIALYVVLSMIAKIPIIAHISLDLGYIVFAVYCYHLGALSGMVVGGVGCVLVSLLASGWFPPGWLVGNLIIGAMCGVLYHRKLGMAPTIVNIIITASAVTLGILGAKTFIECHLYGIPYVVKLPKNAIACITDAIVMSAGVLFAQRGQITHAYWKITRGK